MADGTGQSSFAVLPGIPPAAGDKRAKVTDRLSSSFAAFVAFVAVSAGGVYLSAVSRSGRQHHPALDP